jgi:hypothetical protein
MASVVAAILAIIKAIPAAESLFAQLLAAYSAWKTEQNLADESAKNARNAALIAEALARARPAAPPVPDGVRDLCAACPARVGRG